MSLPSAKVSLRAFLILNSSTWTLLCMVFQFGVKVIICDLFLICWTFCFCKEVKPTFQIVIIFPHLLMSGWHLLFTCMCLLSYWGGFVLIFFHWFDCELHIRLMPSYQNYKLSVIKRRMMNKQFWLQPAQYVMLSFLFFYWLNSLFQQQGCIRSGIT